MTRQTLTLDEINTLLPSLPQREGFSSSLYLCKSGPVVGQLAADVISEPAIDTNALTVRMRISTNQCDRVNHVVRQEGINLELYRDNPIVLFGHGMEGIALPVAVSEDPNGLLTVENRDDGTYAIAHHSKSLKLSMQMFDLVAQRFIRASSIGITPTVLSKGYDTDGDQVLFVEEGYLNEWSYCTIGVNPGARITKSLADCREFLDLQCEVANRILVTNTLDGTPIHPVIRKSLQAAVVTKVSTPGIEVIPPKEEVKMTKSLSVEQIKQMKPKQIAKAMGEFGEYDPATQAALSAAVESIPDLPPEEAPAVGPVDDIDVSSDEIEVPEDESPLGSKVLRSIYDSLGSVIDNATKALAPVENPDVKTAAEDVLQQLRDLATSLEGVFRERYPDQPGLAPAMEEPSDEVVKSFLSQSNRGRDQLRGLAARVEMLAKAFGKNGGKASQQQVRMLAQTSNDLLRINQQAKAFKAPEPVAKEPDLSAYKTAFEELRKQFASIQQAIGEMPLPIKTAE